MRKVVPNSEHFEGLVFVTRSGGWWMPTPEDIIRHLQRDPEAAARVRAALLDAPTVAALAIACSWLEGAQDIGVGVVVQTDGTQAATVARRLRAIVEGRS